MAVVAYYGATTPMDRASCAIIDAARRRGLAALGHKGQRTGGWLAHAAWRDGGYGMAITYVHAAAALAASVDRALGGEEGTPARVAMAAAIGRRYWALGWRPTPGAPRPLDWNPRHVLGSGALQEDAIVDVWLGQRLEAGVATRAGGGEGAPDDMGDWASAGVGDGGMGARMIWEVAGREFGWRLARLGVVRLRHLYGGGGRPRQRMMSSQAARRWRRRRRQLMR